MWDWVLCSCFSKPPRSRSPSPSTPSHTYSTRHNNDVVVDQYKSSSARARTSTDVASTSNANSNNYCQNGILREVQNLAHLLPVTESDIQVLEQWLPVAVKREVQDLVPEPFAAEINVQDVEQQLPAVVVKEEVQELVSQPLVAEREVQDCIQNVRILAPRRRSRSRRKKKSQIVASKLDKGLFNFSNPAVTYMQLNSNDDDYLVISNMVTNKKCFKIDLIQRIDNPFLRNAYELEKLKKQKQHGSVQEKLLFHGTVESFVDEICMFNFDYRKIVRHKFGKGVSFSPNSTYASNYSDQNVYNKVMLVAKVLIVQSCIGNERIIVPPRGYDTTQKGVDGIVIVKFGDSEFYPAYKIEYHTVGKLNRRDPATYH